ncbi:MAG: 16S rRNA (uracil(1498)-N(3))-methyltransferase [Oscillospiraceae bacterium]|nr:16S rRNA (uracil(1498)-N(3))-methyltransferase [Oscillospiraceae bacterium]
MQRFFLSAQNIDIENKILKIEGSDSKHIAQSLRMKQGDTITVCDMQKFEYSCEIISINDFVTAEIISISKNDTEPNYKAYLYQALPKNDKMDYIVQKAVELGVYEIIPFISERCISRPDKKSVDNKVSRWQKISEEAAKQCGRGIIPVVRSVIDYEKALADAVGTKFLCYEGDGTESVAKIICESESDISFFIGPEGGFSMREVAAARGRSLRAVGLGKLILRCETASGFVLACLSYEKNLI